MSTMLPRRIAKAIRRFSTIDTPPFILDNMSKLNYSISSNIYDISDTRALIVNGMRETFIRRGDNFFIRREDVITKMGELELIEVINSILEKISPVKKEEEFETQISKLHMGPNIIEFSIAYKDFRVHPESTIMCSGDILKVFVDLSRGSEMEDDDCSNSIDVEILICAIETVGKEDLCREFFKLLKEEV
jgi:hypothetical protein